MGGSARPIQNAGNHGRFERGSHRRIASHGHVTNPAHPEIAVARHPTPCLGTRPGAQEVRIDLVPLRGLACVRGADGSPRFPSPSSASATWRRPTKTPWHRRSALNRRAPAKGSRDAARRAGASAPRPRPKRAEAWNRPSGGISSSSLLLIRSENARRCQAENPLIPPSEFARPALCIRRRAPKQAHQRRGRP